MSNQENIPSVDIPDEYKDMLSNVNTFVEMANNSDIFTCDAECEKNKTEKTYYDNFLKQQANLLNASKQFDIAEREYITSSKGSDYYQNFKEEEYKIDADKIIEKLNEKMFEIFTILKQQITNNDTLNGAIQNTSELRETYSEKVSNLKTEIDNGENTTNVANRKSYYENQKKGFWCSLNYNLIILFWIMFIAYIIISVVYKQYTKKHVKIALFVIPLLSLIKGSTIYHTVMSFIKNDLYVI
tara:strand:+ start:1010 stop:1735 length:726 start_codon:yes stop_codon:yes gene_type:complete